MSGSVAAAVFACLAWWFATGAILYLDGLPPRTFRWSLLGATIVLAAALVGLELTSAQTSVAAAYAAFGCGVLVWGWLEMTFLMGWLTGPRKQACPTGCRGWRHFVHAIEAILYHELALIGAAVVVGAITWRAPNQVGLWTFAVLWAMRQSAKLNLHFGVRNLSDELLPPHLSYLKSFFTRKPMNLLFPVSVTSATLVAALLVRAAIDAPAGGFEAIGLTLVATLLILAILEHWFLVLPLPVNALWAWGLRSRAGREREAGPGADRDPLLRLGKL
jgi:putative photosynthetic complex assembly protein 2